MRAAALTCIFFAGCGALWTDLPPDRGGPPGACETCDQDAGATPEEPASVRIAAFNVHLFFDPVCDSGKCGPTDWEKVPSPEEFGARADQLAQAISALQADVVLLEEVENQAALDALVTRLPGPVNAVLGEIGGAATVDVAVLSRFPVDGVFRHRDQPIYRPDGSMTWFSRELLEVHLSTEAGRVVVFAAHFRSKVNDDPGRRWAEATAARQYAMDVAGQVAPAIVVVGGDLNDVPQSPPLDALEAQDALIRASAGMPISEIGTYSYYGNWQAIDHLLVVPSAGGQTVPDTFAVIRDSDRGFGGSDHAAIRAAFRLAP